MRRVLAVVVTAGLALAGAAPAAVADPGPHVDLSIFAQLDRPAYLPTDQVTMQVRITNSGTATANDLVVRSTGDLEFGPWGKLDASTGPGIQLGPGEQQTITVTATPKDAGDMTQVLEVASAEPDAQPADNRTSVEAFATAEQVSLALTLHLDGNGDGVLDKGETVVGVEVTVRGGREPWQGTARTDANGVIRFPALPGGDYIVDAGLPHGWLLEPSYRLRLRPGHNEIVVRARHVDLTKLDASISFDKRSYAVGDTIRERVTLTNTGTVDLTGLVARCGHLSIQTLPDSRRNELTSAGWGELDSEVGAGATVRAGETRTWEFTAPVTPVMWEFGFVTIECDFIVPGMLTGAHAKTRAAVPGGTGTVGGTAYHADQPRPGVTFVLIHQATGTIAGRVTSDAAGRIDFPALPADSYELRPLGPWRLMDKVYAVQVRAGAHQELPLMLLPGPSQLDPQNPPQAEQEEEEVRPAPVPQGSRTPHPGNLADTGADVVELLALGALLLVLGMVLVRRRSFT